MFTQDVTGCKFRYASLHGAIFGTTHYSILTNIIMTYVGLVDIERDIFRLSVCGTRQ
jgi:hypothetical protein